MNIKDRLTKYLYNIGFKYFIKSWKRTVKELSITNNSSRYMSNLSKIYDCCKVVDNKINNGESVLQNLFSDKCNKSLDITAMYVKGNQSELSDIFSEAVDRINKGEFICASCERDNRINSIIN